MSTAIVIRTVYLAGGEVYRVTITREPRQHWEALIEQVDA